jgi:hypothetical protein
MGAVRLRVAAVVLAGLSLTILAVPGASPAAGGISAHLVLSSSDVGGHYVLNRAFTSRRTLSELDTAAPRAVRRQLASLWLDGTQTGFNGDRAVSNVAIISSADVFRTSALAAITRWWERRFLDLSRGSRMAIPRGAPGSSRFLLRGHMQRSEVLIYQWRHGRAILETWLVGRPGLVQVPRLLELVRAQDAKAALVLG